MAEEVGGLPPGDNQPPPVIENLLMSVTTWWRLTMDKNTVVGLIGSNFQQDDILTALRCIKDTPGYSDIVGEIKKKNGSHNRSAICA